MNKGVIDFYTHYVQTSTLNKKGQGVQLRQFLDDVLDWGALKGKLRGWPVCLPAGECESCTTLIVGEVMEEEGEDKTDNDNDKDSM